MFQMVGSHWNYNTHYPESFKKFKPVAKSYLPANNTLESIKNSYDNSILYTDHVIGEVIERVKSLNSIVVYLSDHGESIGEDGLFSHTPRSFRPEQQSTSFFVWTSEKYRENFPEKQRAVLANQDKKLCTDLLFHSILDAADIDSEIILESLSVFNTAEKARLTKTDTKDKKL